MDYYNLTPSKRTKELIVSEWATYIPLDNIATEKSGAATVVADHVAEYQEPLLAAMTTEIRGDASRGEIVFSGRSVSDRIRGKVPIITPLKERLSTIK